MIQIPRKNQLFVIVLLFLCSAQVCLKAQCNYSPITAIRYSVEDCRGMTFQSLIGSPIPNYGVSESLLFTSVLTSDIVITSTKDFYHYSFNLYPNPTIGELTIDWLNDEDVDATIVSTLGQIVKKYRFPSNTKVKLDVSELSPGFYSLVIKNKSNQTLSQKFVKQ